MCRRPSAADCSSDCMSVLTARNSTPSTSASTMRFTALTPAPPTPTTRSIGSLTLPDIGGRSGVTLGSRVTAGAGSRSRMLSGMSAEKTERRRSSGLGTPSCAPALFALAPALLALLGAARGLGGAALEALRRLGRGRRRRGLLLRRGFSFARGLLLARAFLVLGLAEEIRQRPFPHARALTASHWPGPPQLADGRRRPPCRPGRTSAPTCPSRAPPRSAPSC